MTVRKALLLLSLVWAQGKLPVLCCAVLLPPPCPATLVPHSIRPRSEPVSITPSQLISFRLRVT